MGFYKKTIMLTKANSYDNGIGVLDIEKTSAGVFATIKAYGLSKENYVLGISENCKKVIKQNVSFPQNNSFVFKLKDDFDIDGGVGCVLCDFDGEKYTPLLWGNASGKAKLKYDVAQFFESENREISAKNISLHSTMQKVENPTREARKLDKQIEENEKLFESDEDEIEEIIDEEIEKEKTFFDLVCDQIEELFNVFPMDEEIAKLIPNSRWVRVDYDGANREYVFGLIYRDNVIKYISYGVPGEYNVPPPDEMSPFSQWLPLDEGGYWLMFQDAVTGESVQIDEMNVV